MHWARSAPPGDRPASPRQSPGERRTRVLSPDTWREVRRLRARGMPIKQIARHKQLALYGAPPSTL
ncbi:helix-turn-helix domain-containing protein [Streptomyces anulatus]|uniref:helix-turn-helix domain-containing protein n=1 Tax=Streptomyces anulatus TaxID=1892 RepID=UPI0039A5DE35